jgi:hypothetical protein
MLRPAPAAARPVRREDETVALPRRTPDLPATERPPDGGWYWNTNRLARAWLPLIGLEGLGLLDFYLAMADHRPGALNPGWTAVTLDELARLTGWGRARLVRLNRLLAATGLLAVRRLPVAGRGPAVRRALYRVQRDAGPPTAAALARLAALAERDSTLAARLSRYAGRPLTDSAAAEVDVAALAGAVALAGGGAACGLADIAADRATVAAARGGEDGAESVDAFSGAKGTNATSGTEEGAPPSPVGAARPSHAGAPAPVSPDDPAPVSRRNRSEDRAKTEDGTTTNARVDASAAIEATDANADRRPSFSLALGPDLAVTPMPEINRAALWDETGDASRQAVLAAWRDANGRPASPLEEQRLDQIAAQVARDLTADAATGRRWVAEAIVEAVEAGSAFVAPRRVARIVERWLTEGRVARRRGAARADARRRREFPTNAGRRSMAGPDARVAGAGDEEAARREDEASRRPTEDCPAAGCGESDAEGVEGNEQASPVTPTWQPPASLAGLPAAAPAVLRAALAAAGLLGDPYLRGAALAGWGWTSSGEPALRIATPAPLPPATAARLRPRLSRGLGAVIGRPVACDLAPWAAPE